MHPVPYHMHLLAVLLLCSLRLSRQIVDLTVPALCALVPTFMCFFEPLDLWWTAVMNCSMIESGPPDSSDGPDLICLSQTHWPIFLNRFDPPRAQFSEPTRFSCLSPIFSIFFVKYTTVFNYYTIFSQQFIFSLFSFL